MNFARTASLLLVPALLAGCGKNFTAYALTSTDSILKFDTKNPSTIESTAQVSGLATNQTIVAMAYDPSGTLYCITNDGYVCNLDPDTGAASVIGSQYVNPNTYAVSPALLGVDPTVSELRVITNSYNFLASENGGASSLETKLFYASGDTNANKSPAPAGIAYTNLFSGAATSTLYVLDSTTGTLDYVDSTNVNGPNAGNAGDLHTVGSTGISFSSTGGFAVEQQNGDAYAALQPSGGQVSLYTVDLGGGSVSNVGAISDGTQSVMSLAIPPGQ